MVFPGEVTSNAFPQTTVDAVLAHMNGDHPDDNLLIAQAFGHPDASAATMTTLDSLGGTWVYSSPDGDSEVTVPWTAEISERPDIRREIVVLYDRACEKLGLTPRAH